MAKIKLIISIDPGFTGYISFFKRDGKLIDSVRTPVSVNVKKTKKRTGKISTKTRKALLEEDIRAVLEKYISKYGVESTLVCIEEQHAMANQGLGSTAKTMYGYGFLVGVSVGLGLKVKKVRARDWQAGMLEPLEDTKQASVEAIQRWDKDLCLLATKRSRKPDHNKADSLNIGRYACQQLDEGSWTE